MKKEVLFYEKLDGETARCHVCPQNCRIEPDKRGVCRVRINDAGTLYATNYGEVSSVALDPIEKKPLYHFYPGHMILSAGTLGCNLSCGFCQNHQIAHGECPTRYISPEQMTALAVECKKDDSIGLAYTYNEPFMWYEYVHDTAPMIKEKGMQNVLVTNGYINPGPLKELIPWIDAVNIDLKSFNERFYLTNCKGRLEPVKETIEFCASRVHVEVTNLIIPEENDRPEEIEGLASWLASINPEIPLHLSRYHPAYNFNRPPTPLPALTMAQEAARAHLKYVYVGNAPGFNNDTRCHNCGATLVKREGYRIQVENLDRRQCMNCGETVSIVN
ncbi:MAG: AmmeMemoRadiSam system radical SAM enzyme [Chitinophagales bacterium]